MKIIYLASFEAQHPSFDVVYQDINGKRDIGGDMMDVDLTPYDVIIATPPCNWWSNAFRTTRKISQYAIDTSHLLPGILAKLLSINKPFIIENVRNAPLFKSHGLFDKGCYIYFVGRHTYWTNVPFNPSNIIQIFDNIQFSSKNKRQGGSNVQAVIDYWLEVVTACK